MSGVYMIHNSVTGRNYIGSSRCVRGRIKTHLSALRGNRHSIEEMQEDFNKYGEESFSFIPLFEVSRDEYAPSLECFVMKVLRTQDKNFGYNYKDKCGTAKWLTREMMRDVHRAFFYRFEQDKFVFQKQSEVV